MGAPSAIAFHLSRAQRDQLVGLAARPDEVFGRQQEWAINVLRHLDENQSVEFAIGALRNPLTARSAGFCELVAEVRSVNAPEILLNGLAKRFNREHAHAVGLMLRRLDHDEVAHQLERFAAAPDSASREASALSCAWMPNAQNHIFNLMKDPSVEVANTAKEAWGVWQALAHAQQFATAMQQKTIPISQAFEGYIRFADPNLSFEAGDSLHVDWQGIGFSAAQTVSIRSRLLHQANKTVDYQKPLGFLSFNTL